MDNIKFSHLKVSINESVETLSFNGIDIEVKQYLPIEQTLNLVGDTINQSMDQNRFYNPGKIDVAFTINILKYYTNIEFSEEELKNQPKLYDAIVSSGLFTSVTDMLPDGEIAYNRNLVDKTIKSIYDYNNSVFGILDTISQDYSNLNLDVDEISKKISNPENLELLKDVMTKLG